MNNELLATLEFLEQERGISKEKLLDTVEKAILSASRKSIHPASELEVKISLKTGEIKAWAILEVVETDTHNDDQISLIKAKTKYSDTKIGDKIKWEVTPCNFGRIAAQTAKQTILQQLRKAEKAIVKEEFSDKIGQIVSGLVRKFEDGNTIIDFGKAEGILTQKEKMPGDSYAQGDRICAILKGLEESGHGPSLILSRSVPEFVIKLFEREVSEIRDGIVEIKKIAREPGARSKIAVASKDQNVDPIGACVGMRGMRVKNVTEELNGEKIDIIKYSDDIAAFAENALQPATIKKIDVDNSAKTLNIKVPSDQLSIAIGKKGQNVRLTAKLLEWKVNIIEEKESKTIFEEKLVSAIKTLSDAMSIGEKSAKALVQNGFLSIEGIKAADIQDLIKIEGLEEEDIEKIKIILEETKNNPVADKE
jgi:N utilization substance protein A